MSNPMPIKDPPQGEKIVDGLLLNGLLLTIYGEKDKNGKVVKIKSVEWKEPELSPQPPQKREENRVIGCCDSKMTWCEKHAIKANPQPKAEWEEEFDNRWLRKNDVCNTTLMCSQIKDFIRQAIKQARQAERERIIEILEGMKTNCLGGYDDALSDAIKEIQDIK